MEFLGVSMRSSDIHFFKDTTLQIIEERKRTGQVCERNFPNRYIYLFKDVSVQPKIQKKIEKLWEKN